MLTISCDTLPNTCLSYVAFRVSFLETLERIVLSRQNGDDAWGSFGYLTEVPFLSKVPPRVQLDLLAETWHRHVSRERVEASLVDESVVYSVCERTAYLAENDADFVLRCLENGPAAVAIGVDRFFAAELRSLHLSLSNDGDFLLISQFEDMHPDEARPLKQQFRLDESRLDAMFEVLGRWHLSPGFFRNTDGLLSEREMARVAAILC